MKNGFAIAIDGPVGVGKSTTAKMVAKELNMNYIDTGAMYRAVALYSLQRDTDLTNATELEESLQNINIDIKHIDGEQRIYLNGKDVTDHIRTLKISNITSIVAGNEAVRAKLVAQQRNLATGGNIVMDGRDIGSHVLPNAQLKIYLDASVQVRAQRRFDELKRKGQGVDMNRLAEEIEARDKRDKSRDISPLVQAADAVYIDSSNMTQGEVVKKIMALYTELRG